MTNKEPLFHQVDNAVGIGFVTGYINSVYILIECFTADFAEREQDPLITEKIRNDLDVIREKLLDIRKELGEQFKKELEARR